MKLSIRTLGDGPDLVLIHGWAMHGGIFAPLSERLSRQFRLHLVDLPGHGDSDDYEAGSLDPCRVAQAIAEATPPAIWLGWSLGGLIALRGALDHPSHIHGLVEIATSPRFVRAEDWPHAVPATIFRYRSSSPPALIPALVAVAATVAASPMLNAVPVTAADAFFMIISTS